MIGLPVLRLLYVLMAGGFGRFNDRLGGFGRFNDVSRQNTGTFEFRS